MVTPFVHALIVSSWVRLISMIRAALIHMSPSRLSSSSSAAQIFEVAKAASALFAIRTITWPTGADSATLCAHDPI